MILYVDQITERLIYTLNFVFNNRKIPYVLCNDWKQFEASPQPKFIYSDYPADDYLQLVPSAVLFDETLNTYRLDQDLFFEQNCLSFNGVIDPLASIFYVLSRYEEYLPFEPDLHQRFPASESLLMRYHWLQQAVCDRWAEDFIRFLELGLKQRFERYPEPAKLIPTVDIDNVFAFQWKDGWRKWMSKAKDFLKRDELRVAARKAFEAGAPDPYDAYDYLCDVSQEGHELHLFWLLGDLGKYDRNLSPADVRHQELIRHMSRFATLGIHPSYRSNEDNEVLQHEIGTLQQILDAPVTASRQHFLKIRFPHTYRFLMQQGITDDFTLGFADEPGFRSGTARPHLFFDVLKNETTGLMLHPFAYMDGTLLDYKKMDPETAKILIRNLWDEVQRYGGDFIFLWHNESLTDFGRWKGWKAVFEYTLSLKKNAVQA